MPTRYAAIVVSTPRTPNSRSIAGKPGRYMSIETGPTAAMAATSSSQRGTPFIRYDRSVDDYATNRFALVHQIERVVDLAERHRVRDQVVDVDLAVHVPVDDLRHIGTAARAAECSALPHPPGHQLERPRLDLLPRARDADDHRDAPAAMAAFERLTHQIDVTDALEAVVSTAVRQRNQVLHQIPADLLRIDEVGEAELLGERAALRIEIHADDAVRAGQPRALHDVQADATQAEHHHVRTR